MKCPPIPDIAERIVMAGALGLGARRRAKKNEPRTKNNAQQRSQTPSKERRISAPIYSHVTTDDRPEKVARLHDLAKFF